MAALIDLEGNQRSTFTVAHPLTAGTQTNLALWLDYINVMLQGMTIATGGIELIKDW